MKTGINIIFILLLSIPCFSQTVEWGNQEKIKGKVKYSQVIGENSSGVFIARSRNSDFRDEIIIEKYKKNLALESSLDLQQPASSWLERLITLESGLISFFSVKNESSDKYDLILSSVDNMMKATTSVTLLSVEASTIDRERKFNIRTSGDKKNLITTYVTRSKDNNKSVLNLHGFDISFAQKFVRKFSLDGLLENISILSSECDNNGNIFVLVNILKEKSARKNKDVKEYYLYAYYPAIDNMLEYEIKRDSCYINEAALVINNYSKSVGVAGFYSNKNDNKCIGHFFFNLNISTTEMEVKRFDEFEASFISRVVGSMKNETDILLSDLKVRKLVANSDGGCTIVSEKYYETRQSYTSNINGFPHTSYNVVYNYDEIIFIARKGDGTIRFRDFVKKNHSSIGDGGYYSSFVTVLNNDKIHLVYNFDASSDGDIMLVTLTNKGIMNTKVLIKAMSYYVSIMPPESRQVGANSAIITTLKDRRFCLMRLTL